MPEERVLADRDRAGDGVEQRVVDERGRSDRESFACGPNTRCETISSRSCRLAACLLGPQLPHGGLQRRDPLVEQRAADALVADHALHPLVQRAPLPLDRDRATPAWAAVCARAAGRAGDPARGSQRRARAARGPRVQLGSRPRARASSEPAMSRTIVGRRGAALEPAAAAVRERRGLRRPAEQQQVGGVDERRRPAAGRGDEPGLELLARVEVGLGEREPRRRLELAGQLRAVEHRGAARPGGRSAAPRARRRAARRRGRRRSARQAARRRTPSSSRVQSARTRGDRRGGVDAADAVRQRWRDAHVPGPRPTPRSIAITAEPRAALGEALQCGVEALRVGGALEQQRVQGRRRTRRRRRAPRPGGCGPRSRRGTRRARAGARQRGRRSSRRARRARLSSAATAPRTCASRLLRRAATAPARARLGHLRVGRGRPAGGGAGLELCSKRARPAAPSRCAQRRDRRRASAAPRAAPSASPGSTSSPASPPRPPACRPCGRRSTGRPKLIASVRTSPNES